MAAAGGLLLAFSGGPVQAAGAEPVAAAAVVAAPEAVAAVGSPAAQSFSQVLLSTLGDCQLAVSVYPTFSYNAAGGGGTGTVRARDDGLLQLVFDPSTLNIPPINYQHAAIIGIPVPPPLNIAIVPQVGCRRGRLGCVATLRGLPGVCCCLAGCGGERHGCHSEGCHSEAAPARWPILPARLAPRSGWRARWTRPPAAWSWTFW